MDSDMDKIFSGSTVLLCVDLQVCYYQQPVTQLFPRLEENVEKVLTFCRESHIQVAHVRQEDVPGDDGLSCHVSQIQSQSQMSILVRLTRKKKQ